MFTVTYYSYSPVLKKGWHFEEVHTSISNIRLRALALDYQVEKVIDADGNSIDIAKVMDWRTN